MKVVIKRYEYLATEHAKKFAKGWDYYCIAVGAYLEGYQQAKRDAVDKLASGSDDEYFVSISIDEKLGNELVEQEITDGMHQLSLTTFEKLQNES